MLRSELKTNTPQKQESTFNKSLANLKIGRYGASGEHIRNDESFRLLPYQQGDREHDERSQVFIVPGNRPICDRT